MYKSTSIFSKKKIFSTSKFLYQLDGATVRFGESIALKNISLTIERGDFLFVTGSSGAGKTTLLRLLSSEIKPDNGLLRMSDPTLFSAQVFQDIRLVTNLSLMDNLLLSFDPSLYSNKAEFLNELDELSRVLGCHGRLDIIPRNANGGLKQKVAIIRALLSRPDVVIADEPSSSLDFDNTKKIYDVLNYYNVKKGTSIVWATHNRELVKKFTGKTIHLDMGKLVYTGHACFI